MNLLSKGSQIAILLVLKIFSLARMLKKILGKAIFLLKSWGNQSLHKHSLSFFRSTQRSQKMLVNFHKLKISFTRLINFLIRKEFTVKTSIYHRNLTQELIKVQKLRFFKLKGHQIKPPLMSSSKNKNKQTI